MHPPAPLAKPHPFFTLGEAMLVLLVAAWPEARHISRDRGADEAYLGEPGAWPK